MNIKNYRAKKINSSIELTNIHNFYVRRMVKNKYIYDDKSTKKLSES